MEEKVFDVEMIYIRNTLEDKYTVEFIGRRNKSVELKFLNVEGIEIDAKKPLEIKHSFLQMNESQPKVWNLKFYYPVDIRIKYEGKIIIEVF